mmetsp:Transcript_28079/g.47061  ORF Transcript_28079/g.47061 Transcript_28079/m.47061 type:complete len:304 (+) Transcript_28079:3-914(+)
MWKLYFQPVSAINAKRRMRGEEIQELKKPELWGLHRECELSVRTYYYGTADGFRQEDRFRDDWYFQNRQWASQVLWEHVKVQQSVLDYADMFWTRKGLANASSVIGVHIRGTDKKEEYRKVRPAEYMPYVNRYLEAFPGSKVFLATDSPVFLADFLTLVTDATRVEHTQARRTTGNVFREDSGVKARTVIGRQVLTDSLLLSKCSFLLKSDSAVSEFSIYWNLALHNNSVDLQYHNGRRQPHWMAGVDVTVPEADLTPDDRLQSVAAESDPEWSTLPTKAEMEMVDRMLDEPEGGPPPVEPSG